MSKSYDMGKAAHDAGLPREPLKDHTFEAYIQTNHSADHHPKSPAVTMSQTQRDLLQSRILEWKQGWDDAHKTELEKK